MSKMELDTNFLNTDNQSLILGQDLLTNIAFSAAIENPALIAKGIVKVGQTILSKTIQKAIAKKIENSIIKQIVKKIIALLEQQIFKSAVSTGVKVGASLGAEAATAGAVVGTSCIAGPTPLCVGGAVVAAVMLCLDIANLLMTLMDTHGYTIVFDKKFIDNIATTYSEALNNGFEKSGIKDFFDTEIVFEPSDFVFKFNPVSNVMETTPEWGPRYNELVDEYLKTAGVNITDWRTRANKLPVITPPLSPPTPDTPPPPGGSNKTIIIILIILLVLFIFGGGIYYFT